MTEISDSCTVDVIFISVFVKTQFGASKTMWTWKGEGVSQNVHITRQALFSKMVSEGGGGKISKKPSTWFMND